MTRTLFTALVAVVMGFSLVSCEKYSTFVGLGYMEPMQDITPENQEPESQEDEPSLAGSTLSNPAEDTSTLVEVEKILPPEWGKIVGADISAVPADDEDKDIDKKCLIIRTELGAVTVVFPREECLPEVADIVVANFTEGNFDESYDSAIYLENNWSPASAADAKDRLNYLIDGKVRRNIRYSTLDKWDWQNKDDYFTTKVSGYDITVENGILNVVIGGEQKLHIR